MAKREAGVRCDLFKCCVEAPLGVVGESEVDDDAAAGAHEVMVVASQILGEFETSVIVAGNHAVNYACVLQ